MKQGWEIKRLDDLAEIKGGKRVPKGYRLKIEPTSYPYIRVTDFNDNGSVDLNDIHYIDEEVFNQIKKYTISSNDLYISIAGTIGKTGIIPKELDGSNLTENACKLVFNKNVDAKLVYYFTKSEDFLKQAGLNTRIAAMPKLALTRLKTISLLFPKSLPEQKRIVAILDKAFAAIDKAKGNAEQNLKNTKELFESFLQGMFENKGEGWEEKTLGEVIDLISGQHINSKDYNVERKGIGYLTGPSDFGPISPLVSKWTEYPKKTAIKNDILITVKGSGVGKINLMNINELCISRQLMAIRSKNINVSFLYAFISTKYDYFQSLSNGAAIPGISRNDVEELIINIPSITGQRTIVKKLDVLSAETNKLEAIYQQKINNLEELKKSVLQKAFKGELTEKEIAL